MIPPQLSDVEWCAKCPEKAYFDINCTYIKFTNKHFALSTQGYTGIKLAEKKIGHHARFFLCNI